MLQLEKTVLSNPERRRASAVGSSQFPFPRYICSHETQSGAPCANNACLKPEPNHCCLWCLETCDHECPEKKLNPEFVKEVGMLYRTGGIPFYKKKPVRH